MTPRSKIGMAQTNKTIPCVDKASSTTPACITNNKPSVGKDSQCCCSCYTNIHIYVIVHIYPIHDSSNSNSKIKYMRWTTFLREHRRKTHNFGGKIFLSPCFSSFYFSLTALLNQSQVHILSVFHSSQHVRTLLFIN